MTNKLTIILVVTNLWWVIQNRSIVQLQNNEKQLKKYVIIDTDGGSDDAEALMLAFDYHKRGLIKILAVTCTYGNVDIDQVVKNVLLTRRVSNAENVKVYKGAKNPLIKSKGHQDNYFGEDGLGNASYSMADIAIRIEREYAALTIIRLTRQYANMVSLITLGPMTNLAMAIQIDPQITNYLAQIVSMGGLLNLFGNVGPTTEFNFFNDPEAVQLVLEKSNCPLSIVTFDVALNHKIPLRTFFEITNSGTKRAEFLGRIYRLNIELEPENNGVNLVDALAVIAALEPQFVTKTKDYPVQMELNGNLTRGQLVVGRTTLRTPFYGSRNATFLERFDLQKSIQLISQMVTNE